MSPKKTKQPLPVALKGASSFDLMAMAKRLNYDVSAASRALGELRLTVDAMRGVLYDAARNAKQRERDAQRLVVCGAIGRGGRRCQKRVSVPGTLCERHQDPVLN